MMGLMLLTMLLMTPYVAGQGIMNCTDCHTKQCVFVGDATINGVDRSVNPCDNFYQYACGGWLQGQFPTNERRRIDFTDVGDPLAPTIKLLSQGFKDGDPDAVKKAKNLFKSCQNSVPGYGITISNIVTDLFGTWPLGCEQCNISVYNLERSLIEMTRLGVHPLFTLSAHANHLNYNVTTKKVKRYLHIGQPTLLMPVDYYQYIPNNDELLENYVNYIFSVAKKFVSITNKTAAREDALEVFKVEKAIATEIRLNREATAKSNLGSVHQNYGQLMNWTRYVNELASTRDRFRGKIKSNVSIYVKYPSVLNSTINDFLALPKRIQVNYLIWRLVDTLHNVLIKPDDKLHTIFQYETPEPYDVAYKEEPCARFVTQTLPLAVHRLLYAEYLTPVTVQKVNMMLQQMKYEFNALLPSNPWLDENAKRFIKEKIDSVTAVVAKYFEVMDDQFLDSYYSHVEIVHAVETIEPDFIRLIRSVKTEAFIKNFRTIRQPEKVDLEEPPQVFSAQLVTQIHEIILSFASVVYPWFVDQAPMAVNYAGAVHILAHALLKSVDSHGLRYHRNGTKGLWIGGKTKAEFDKRVECLLDQHENYTSSAMYRAHDSDKFLNDNEAVKLAFKAYRNYTDTATTKRYNIAYSGFTNDQLFFVRAAQLFCTKATYVEDRWKPSKHHTLPEFRVNGPLQNSLDFAFIFKCPCGSPMNPLHKCEVW